MADLHFSGKDPVTFFAEILRNEAAPLDLRFAAAKELAPFMHPKLASIEARTGARSTRTDLRILRAKASLSLALTPPKEGTSAAELERDDGLLTASEVAQLQLDADWVLLSACNTAGGEKGNAEAFSGLARAFFYAKARALLVSHWYVDSEAAVKLTTGSLRSA